MLLSSCVSFAELVGFLVCCCSSCLCCSCWACCLFFLLVVVLVFCIVCYYCCSSCLVALFSLLLFLFALVVVMCEFCWSTIAVSTAFDVELLSKRCWSTASESTAMVSRCRFFLLDCFCLFREVACRESANASSMTVCVARLANINAKECVRGPVQHGDRSASARMVDECLH